MPAFNCRRGIKKDAWRVLGGFWEVFAKEQPPSFVLGYAEHDGSGLIAYGRRFGLNLCGLEDCLIMAT